MDMGELLAEVHDGGYHLTWGFQNFGLWLEQSGIDLSERAAYYLIKIVQTGKKLEIPRDTMESVKLSKLREIARLDADKHGKRIKQLIEKCVPDGEGHEMSLEDVRVNVQKILGGSDKIDVFVYITLKVSKQTKEEVIDPAIEIVKAQYGDVTDSQDNVVEMTPGRAIELICAEYLNGAEKDAEAKAASEEGEVDTGEDNTIDVEAETEQLALPPADEEYAIHNHKTAADLLQEELHSVQSPVSVEYHVNKVEDATLPPHSGEVLKVVGEALPLLNALIANPAAVAGLAERGLKINEEAVEDMKAMLAVDSTVADCRARMAAAEARVTQNLVLTTPAEAVALDPPAGAAKVTTTPDDDQDPLHDDALKLMKHNPQATPTSLKLTFRIGEGRANTLWNTIKKELA